MTSEAATVWNLLSFWLQVVSVTRWTMVGGHLGDALLVRSIWHRLTCTDGPTSAARRCMRYRLEAPPFFSDQQSADFLLWGFRTEALSLACGGPQCSSLSLTLFSVYVDPLAELVHSFGFHILSYADDTQIIMSISNDLTSVAEKLHFCMSSISGWMKHLKAKCRQDWGFGVCLSGIHLV